MHYAFVLETFNSFLAMPVLLSAVITDGNSILEFYLMATLAHPACNLSRIAKHKSVIRHILGHHRSCADKGVSAYGMSGYDRGIGANCCALFDQGFFEFMFSGNMTSGIDNIGKKITIASLNFAQARRDRTGVEVSDNFPTPELLKKYLPGKYFNLVFRFTRF